MKLATALSQRADLQSRIAEIGTRLNNNAKVQEGEKPAEEPEALLKELNGMLASLEDLMTRINLTNSKTLVDGKTLTELLAHRDCLNNRLQIMRKFLDTASCKVDRYSRTEIKIVNTVNVTELQKDVDRISKDLRGTDEQIQALNWTTDLM